MVIITKLRVENKMFGTFCLVPKHTSLLEINFPCLMQKRGGQHELPASFREIEAYFSAAVYQSAEAT